MDVAKYAAVDNTVELCKAVKKDNAGFINAVLKKFIDYKLVLPNEHYAKEWTESSVQTGNSCEDGDGILVDLNDRDNRASVACINAALCSLSVKYSYPVWIVEKYLKYYKTDAEKILSFKESNLEHVRIICDKKEFIDLLKKGNILFSDSALINGVYVDYKKLLNSDIPKNLYIGQNLGSMMIVDAVDLKQNDVVLDACAAPGGKSLYMAAKCNKVLACDVSIQKIEKIQENAKRLNIKNVETKISDATVLQNLGMFDKVLCDVPCSGLGITYSKPDIKLHRTPADIKVITDIQREILQTCKNYVKENGFLMYSTCTLLKEENEDIVNRFLENNKNFEKRAEKTILPHIYNTEGFYYCILQKR